MPSPLSPLFSQLPTELCDRIFAFAKAIDSRPDSERWMAIHPETGASSLLRVLSQVNRAMRAAIMPLLWTDISLEANRKHFESIIALRYLIEDLKASKGPMPGPKDYIQSIEFRIESDCLAVRNAFGDRSFRTERQTSEDKALKKELRQQLGFAKDDKDAVSRSIRELSQQLINCTRLTALKWKGWVVPDPIVLVNLSQCSSLKYLSVDLDSPTWSMLRRWHMPEPASCTANTPRILTRRFLFNKVHFAAEPYVTISGCSSCDSIGPLDHRINPKEGEAGVALLTAFGLTKELALRDPLLLYQRWMLPLWAQLERLEFDHSYFQPKVRRRRSLSSYEPRDPEMDYEMLQAAQVFPHLLDRSRRIRRLLYPCPNPTATPSDIYRIAKAVFDLIHTAPELKNWTYWFPKWDDLPYEDPVYSSGFVRTKSIMANVATVLAQRYELTQRRRERYSTPPPEDLMQALESTLNDESKRSIRDDFENSDNDDFEYPSE